MLSSANLDHPTSWLISSLVSAGDCRGEDVSALSSSPGNSAVRGCVEPWGGRAGINTAIVRSKVVNFSVPRSMECFRNFRDSRLNSKPSRV